MHATSTSQPLFKAIIEFIDSVIACPAFLHDFLQDDGAIIYLAKDSQSLPPGIIDIDKLLENTSFLGTHNLPSDTDSLDIMVKFMRDSPSIQIDMHENCFLKVVNGTSEWELDVNDPGFFAKLHGVLDLVCAQEK